MTVNGHKTYEPGTHDEWVLNDTYPVWVGAVTSPMHSFIGMLVDRTKSDDLGLVVAGLAPWVSMP